MNFAAFPLDLVVLPGELVALHLFEDRYLQLYEDHQDGKEFAIVYKNGKSMDNFASLVQIDQTANLFPDGTLDIIVKGVGALEIEKFNEQTKEKLYPSIIGKAIHPLNTVADDLKSSFESYLRLIKKKLPIKNDYNLFYVANRLELDCAHKKELMCLTENREMNCYLINQIRLMSRCLELEEKLKQKFHLN